MCNFFTLKLVCAEFALQGLSWGQTIFRAGANVRQCTG